MSTLLADPARVNDRLSGTRQVSSQHSVRVGASSPKSAPAAPTRRRANRTGPRVGPRGLNSSPLRAGAPSPSVRHPMPLEAALSIGAAETSSPRTQIVVAPIRYRLTERGLAVVAAVVLIVVCIASFTAAARFVTLTADAGAGASSSSSVGAPSGSGPVVPDAPRL